MSDEFDLLWIERTWNDVRPGDRVRMKGVEAVVDAVMRRTWHVHPSSRYQVTPFEHDDVSVRLAGREKLFIFKPDLPVEIQLTRHEIEFLDAWGWDTRLVLITQRMKELLK